MVIEVRMMVTSEWRQIHWEGTSGNFFFSLYILVQAVIFAYECVYM